MRIVGRAALALIAGASVLAALDRRGRTSRVLRISRVVADLDRAEAFYRDGLGFRRIERGPGGTAFPALLGIPGASCEHVVMRLGAEEIALVRFDPPGAPYPPHSRSDDLWFQHLAIVVDDMEAAFRHLEKQSPPPVSTHGPERLPPGNGSVMAFKFRDPDGHPLELLQFPPGQGRPVWQRRARMGTGPFLGIDHSALAVAATAQSLRFYRSLGFRVAARSLNDSEAQSRLDGVPGARVRVTSLRPRGTKGAGLELLAYAPPGRPAPATAANSTVTDWVTLQWSGQWSGQWPGASSPGPSAMVRRDPDGHIMLLTRDAIHWS
jgi:catechol 2,3-dioxygenase-like lactoylglutathione lyase family enzyme